MSKSKRLHSDKVYKDYMIAYDAFFKKRKAIFKRSCLKLDSQFSESLAADYVDFDLKHKDGFDGFDSNNESYEVKGTGYTNNKVHFNVKYIADHVIWVKAEPKKVTIYEMDTGLYQNLDANGFVDLSKQNIVKTIHILTF